jgi:hypothetical protein
MTDKQDKDPWDPTRRLDIEVRGDLIKRTLFIPKLTNNPAHVEDAEQDPFDDATAVTDTDANAICFRDFAEHWLEFGLDKFVQSNPYHFLIQETSLTDSSSSDYFTVTGSGSKDCKLIDLFSATLYRLKKKSRGRFPHMITVGRANNNDVFIKDNLVSKFHSYFSQRNKQWFVADSGSTNGTFVNGKALEATVPHILTNNCLISFSDNLKYRFVDAERVLSYLRFFETQRIAEEGDVKDHNDHAPIS